LPQGAYQPIYYVSQEAAVLAHKAQQNNLLHGLRVRIQSLASTESLEGFSLKEMFSEVFKRRSAADVEDYILVGTSKTTPPIELIETGWPKPWLFFRLLALMVVAYVVLTFMFMQTGNANCVPGMMFLGAFVVPLAEHPAQRLHSRHQQAVSDGCRGFVGRCAARLCTAYLPGFGDGSGHR
jgi:RsiW-degrading membrane proteinase PrsW (M82 family)